MTNTERVHRHRQRLREEAAEQERIQRVYFDGRPPLTDAGRRRLIRQLRLEE